MKKYFVTITMLVLIISLFVACGTQDSPVETSTMNTTVADTEETVLVPIADKEVVENTELVEIEDRTPETVPAPEPLNVEPGFHHMYFQSSYVYNVPYNIYIPENATTDMPVIFWLHGMDELAGNLPDNFGVIKQVRELNENRFIVVQPNAGSAWHVQQQCDAILELVEEIVTTYQIDRNRIILTGHSLGSMGAWYYAEYAPDLWAAVIPVSNKCTTSIENLSKSDLTIRAICSTWDVKKNIDGMKETVDALLLANPEHDVEYVLMEKYSHGDMSWAPYDQAFFDWAAEQTK